MSGNKSASSGVVAGHAPSPQTIRRIVERLGTPTYVFQAGVVSASLAEFRSSFREMPLRHLYSYKTCPIPQVAGEWVDAGGDIEVVSEAELIAALSLCHDRARIVVNGPAKHRWLPKYRGRMHVHLDSVGESSALLAVASDMDWSIGLRLHPSAQVDPDNPALQDQFGLDQVSAEAVLREANRKGVTIESVHMHIHSNASRQTFTRALEQLGEMLDRLRLRPRCLDVGGGLAAPGITLPASADRAMTKDEYVAVLQAFHQALPWRPAFWVENGRYHTARTAYLVLQVLDVKRTGEHFHLICDGGRTLHALVSDWEGHAISYLGKRAASSPSGAQYRVCGPTCMAYDNLGMISLSGEPAEGDVVVWHDAGAYHIPWETRFSHPAAAVVLDSGNRFDVIRERQALEDLTGQWAPMPR